MDTTAAKRIAVFGATGQQGGAVVDALEARGAQIRALVRDPGSEAARALAERGIELARIDLDAPATVRSALEGVDAFFFMTTPGRDRQAANEIRQGTVLADGAAGVPHVVFSSVGGAERHTRIPHFESKRAVEEYLLERGVPAVFVRPVFFMENLTFMGAAIENGEVVVRLPLPADVPLQMVAVRDIGTAAAAALLEPDAVDGSIEIAGDERTGPQIADAIGEHTGLPARYEALPLSVLGDADSHRMFEWFAEDPAYQADIPATRSLAPGLLDLPGWLTATGWTPKTH
ncbi:NmrA/HSCARG family protein [Glycomyces dulcitolivorans]|uniref:NmrA/HSCARG family protein n=1 Tax=Glycomyces dulcitolivorans TaxID=2200759 RepID=UPI000DD43CFE|nr:NmrA/HSCARG family protein [Glycomyces dulcitolivorans]